MSKVLKIFCILMLAFLQLNVIGQIPSNLSAAGRELYIMRSLQKYPSEKQDSLRCAWYGECSQLIPPTGNPNNPTCTLLKRVFGWHTAGTSSSSYIWQSISDLSYFCYSVDPYSGNSLYPSDGANIANWQNDPVIIAAHNNGVKINLCVFLSSGYSTFFTNLSYQQTLITNLINAVSAANANGVNIDFEGLSITSTYQQQFITFMSNLSTQLHNSIPGSELTMDFMGSWSSLYSFINQLIPYVDIFIMMGYDYYIDGGNGSPCGPVAPTYSFNGGGNVSNDVNNFLKTISPDKFILGIPYYGRTWPTGQSNCYIPMSAIASGNAYYYNNYKNNSSHYFDNPYRDPASLNPYFCYNYQATTWKQAFNDDIVSYQQKYNLIKERGIAGVALWRLGFDAGFSDLWNLINDNLSACQITACSSEIYDMGGPQGNYHNNEDYTFTIAPTNATSVTLSFISFSLENNNDYLKVYNGPSTTSPLISTLTGSSLPASITSTGSSLTMQFHSNSTITQSGYDAIYTCNTSGGGQPDLTIVNQAVSSSTVAAGSNITAYGAESNSGNANAGANIISLYLSSDGVLTPGSNGDIYLGFINIPSVPANGSSIVYSGNIQIPNGTAPGNYYLFFWADGGQVISESNESNNFATVPIAVISSTQTYTINTSSNPTIGGSTSGGGTLPSGQPATVIATNNPGYTFLNWTENGNQVTSTPSYTFIVTGNRNLVANFTNCSYTLNSYSVTLYSPATSYSFWVYTTSFCSWMASTSGCSWLTFTNSTGTGNGMVTFNITENTSSSARSCNITVGGQTFTLTQNGYSGPCSSPPIAPSNLEVVGTIGSNILYVGWSDNSTTETSFVVERAPTVTGPFTTIATLGPNTSGYADYNVIGGTSYCYRVKACCNSNCSAYTNIACQTACTYSVTPTGVVATANTICAGESVTLNVEGGTLGTGASWVWRLSPCHTGTIVGNGSTITITPSASGTYVVGAENASCPMPNTYCAVKYITVNPLPAASTISANGVTTFCEGNSVTLTGNNGGIWNNGATTSSITVNTSGDYFVTNSNACGNSVSNHILVTVIPLPIALAGVDVDICSGTSTSIGSSPVVNYTYSWSPTTYLSNSTISNPSASPISSTTYTVTTTNSLGCFSSDQVIVSVNSGPSAAGTITGPPVVQQGETGVSYSVTPIADATGYVWTLPTGGTIVAGDNTNTITVNFSASATSGNMSVYGTNTCGSGSVSPNLYISFGANITGVLTYNNTANTVLDSVWVTLRLNNIGIDSTRTNLSGAFNFTGKANGTYTIKARTGKAWSSVNATDAIKVQRHFAGLELVTEPVRLLAGDVNLSNSINATDAIKIKRRFSGLDNYFDRGDWIFAKPTAGGDTIIVSGVSVTQNFYGLCVGDVNGSNIPSTGKWLSQRVEIANEGTIDVKPGLIFELPITARNVMSVSAISLVIPYPEDLLEVEDVQIGQGVPVINILPNQVRVAWSELQPMNLKAGETLLTLKIRAKEAFTGDQSIQLTPNFESELADELGEVIPPAELTSLIIKPINVNGIIDFGELISSCKVYPNPAKDYITIELQLNSTADCGIAMLDLVGREVKMIPVRKFEKGNSKVIIQTKELVEGMYTIKLTLTSGVIQKDYLQKIVVNR